jgi:hypothetical protein
VTASQAADSTSCPASVSNSTRIKCDTISGDCDFKIQFAASSSNYAQIQGVGNSGDYGTGFGWAQLSYQVIVPVTPEGKSQTVDLLSTPGSLNSYVRPLPVGTGITVTKTPNPQQDNLIAGTSSIVKIKLNGIDGCVSNCGYTHPLNQLASSIIINTPSVSPGLTIDYP